MFRFARLAVVALMAQFAGLAITAASQTVTWDTLAPETGAPIIINSTGQLKGMPKKSDFGGSQEDLDGYLEDMEVMRSFQPEGGFLNTALNGKQIKIAGYITPLAFDGEYVSEFLFVPFLGACVHVPPPEANQIIHVTNVKGVATDAIWDPFWLAGTIKAAPVATVLAEVGYQIQDPKVTAYDGPDDGVGGVKSVD